MKIKLGEIKSRHQALCMVGNKNLPVKLAYAIGKNIIKLQEETENIEKTRIKLVQHYAEKDENGEFIIKDERYDVGKNGELLNKEFAELLDTETEVSIHTITEDVLELLENERYDVLSPAEMIAIDFMIENPQGTVTEETEPKA